MNKTLRLFLIWALVMSPVLLGVLITRMHPDRQGDPVMMLHLAVGVTIIGVVGLMASVLTRKTKDADKLSIIGYAIPAILVGGFLVR